MNWVHGAMDRTELLRNPIRVSPLCHTPVKRFAVYLKEHSLHL